MPLFPLALLCLIEAHWGAEAQLLINMGSADIRAVVCGRSVFQNHCASGSPMNSFGDQSIASHIVVEFW